MFIRHTDPFTIKFALGLFAAMLALIIVGKLFSDPNSFENSCARAGGTVVEENGFKGTKIQRCALEFLDKR